MLFKRKVSTVEAEQFLPKEGDATFTLFGQECKIFRNDFEGFNFCYFTDATTDDFFYIQEGQYLMKGDDGCFQMCEESYIKQYFEPVKE